MTAREQIVFGPHANKKYDALFNLLFLMVN